MTEAKPVSPGKKALDYAEKDLGVHSVHELARTCRESLDATLTDLSEARDKMRDLESRLEIAELDVVAEEREKHPDMSQAQMDKHIKVAFSKNAEVQKIRSEIRSTRGDIDGLELDEKMYETDIKIAVARMTELGGYFNYLAVIKQLSLPKGVPSDPSPVSADPWS